MDKACKMPLKEYHYLIAGYVKIVAIVFDIAPNMKAADAERAKGEEPGPPSF